ncbi:MULTISPECIES: hypothetical protein [Hyphomonas]|uniref:Uncharacterized protein n=1 Tax=Hyphomonas atlantica TaxID=1280948 RepID=A0A059DZX7_9PROT|nr:MULTISPECIES: hypothetical protein [Hyphomonas]KCZ60043.1 hypothetical protein HY36_17805 [Hyphomonas atlantica]MAM07229.1 hypothetical protein [Hyphomonas sp.]|tara:strand:- start:1103 stop:1663 length:561 start_codon:yes stop_codon:yes gene_type:complete
MTKGFYAYLLLSGFLPINAILLAKSFEQGQYIFAWIMLVLVNLGAFATIRVRDIVNSRDEPDTYKLVSSTPIDESILVYVVTYVPLLLDVNLSTLSGAISLLIFYVIMAIVFVRSKTLFVNPIFMLLGWRFYLGIILSEKKEYEVLLVAKNTKLHDGVNYRLRRLTNLQTYVVSSPKERKGVSSAG